MNISEFQDWVKGFDNRKSGMAPTLDEWNEIKKMALSIDFGERGSVPDPSPNPSPNPDITGRRFAATQTNGDNRG